MITLLTTTLAPVLAIYAIIGGILLMVGLTATFTGEDSDERQVGAVIALTAIIWPLWIPVGVFVLIYYLFCVALGKE